MQVIDLFVPAKNDEMLFRFFRSLSLSVLSPSLSLFEEIGVGQDSSCGLQFIVWGFFRVLWVVSM